MPHIKQLRKKRQRTQAKDFRKFTLHQARRQHHCAQDERVYTSMCVCVCAISSAIGIAIAIAINDSTGCMLCRWCRCQNLLPLSCAATPPLHYCANCGRKHWTNAGRNLHSTKCFRISIAACAKVFTLLTCAVLVMQAHTYIHEWRVDSARL